MLSIKKYSILSFNTIGSQKISSGIDTYQVCYKASKKFHEKGNTRLQRQNKPYVPCVHVALLVFEKCALVKIMLTGHIK